MASTSTRDTGPGSTSTPSRPTALARSIAALSRLALPIDRRKAPSFETTAQSGRYGERVAARFLRREGLRVLLRNVKTEGGEIDLVCREGKVLAFVEVKSRRDSRFGEPSQAVDAAKRARLVRAAQVYLRELRHPRIDYRFDIAEVFLREGEIPSCRFIRDAFGVHPRD